MANLRYPLSKLDASDDYLKITSIDYVAPGFNNTDPNNSYSLPSANDLINNKLAAGDKSIIHDTIILPVPDSIGDMNAVDWTSSGFNPVEATAAKFLQNGLDLSNIPGALKGMQDTLADVFKAANSGTTQRVVESMVIAAASNAILGGDRSYNELLSRYNGAITNSNVELIFSGIKLRSAFTFSFDMAPRSKDEADQIKTIIRSFKKNSAAKRAGTGTGKGLFLKAPNVFKLEYYSGANPHLYLNRFKICALNGMAVDYTPNGTYTTYPDGAPVSAKLSLVFQELSPIFSEDYDTTEGSYGTGY
mgnify:CR=1 FL=1|jgi:hypothetical protein